MHKLPGRGAQIGDAAASGGFSVEGWLQAVSDRQAKVQGLTQHDWLFCDNTHGPCLA